jgi:hypothetical protein
VSHSPLPAVVIFRNLESSVRAWLHQQHPSVSADQFRVLLEACVPPRHVVVPYILESGMCSTLSAHIGPAIPSGCAIGPFCPLATSGVYSGIGCLIPCSLCFG